MARNQIDLKLNNNTYPLKLTWGAIEQIEERLPRSIVEIIATYDGLKIKFSELRTIIHITAKAANPAADLDTIDADLEEEGVMTTGKQLIPFLIGAFSGAPKKAASEKKVK